MIGVRWAVRVAVVAVLAGAPGVGTSPAPGAEPAGTASEPDALKARGIVRAGNAYVLADEAPLLEAIKALRLTRKQADRETATRKKAEDKVAANQKFIKDGYKEYKDLEKRLPKIKDVQTHNRTVTRMNALADRVKEAIDGQKDLEEQANKVPSEFKTKFVDSLLTLAPKFDAVATRYRDLADDAAVKAALQKVNATANPKVTFGPSPDFIKAVDEVATWRGAIDSEAIPLREYHGVYTVDAIVNGEHMQMIVDTGASHITIPFEAAKKLNMTPTEQDPTVQMKLANGTLIDGKLMTLKSVRVGRFTVPNVSCVVLQEGLSDPPTMLGGSFLSHFVVKLSQSARELYLTEVTEGKSTDAPKPAAAGPHEK